MMRFGSAALARGELLAEVLETFRRSGERLIAFRKSEPQHVMAEFGTMIEARAGHRGNTDHVEKKGGCLEVIAKTQLSMSVIM